MEKKNLRNSIWLMKTNLYKCNLAQQTKILIKGCLTQISLSSGEERQRNNLGPSGLLYGYQHYDEQGLEGCSILQISGVMLIVNCLIQLPLTIIRQERNLYLWLLERTNIAPMVNYVNIFPSSCFRSLKQGSK